MLIFGKANLKGMFFWENVILGDVFLRIHGRMCWCHGKTMNDSSLVKDWYHLTGQPRSEFPDMLVGPLG